MSIKPTLKADYVSLFAFAVFQFGLSGNLIAIIEIFIEGEAMVTSRGKNIASCPYPQDYGSEFKQL